jgi:hypothetical protein
MYVCMYHHHHHHHHVYSLSEAKESFDFRS